jgi:hypothetical protein
MAYVLIKLSQYEAVEAHRVEHCLESVDSGEVVSLMSQPRFTPRKIIWYSFLLEAE